MLVNVLTIVGSVVAGLAVPAFGYLKYRAYTNTVRHVVDQLGVDGLEKIPVVFPPANLGQQLQYRHDTKRHR